MKIAVAGGTGVLGRHVVEAARSAGHEVAVLSRRQGVDVISGSGLTAALEGAEVIVDCSNGPVMSGRAARSFFCRGTANLHDHGRRAGARRLLSVSIVGIDRATRYPYYAAKLAQEQAAVDGPLPASIVRITQFHEFPAQVLKRGRIGPVALVPHFRVQSVAARSAGEVLAELVADPDPPAMVEVAGPAVNRLDDLIEAVIARRHLRIRTLPLLMPGATARAMNSGALTVTGNPSPPGAAPARIVGPAFEEWLEGPDVEAVDI